MVTSPASPPELRKFGVVLWILFCIFPSLSVAAEARHSHRLALFVTRAPGDAFWGLFAKVMQQAVDDLGMRLDIYYAHGNREKMRQQILEATHGPQKADVLVFPNFKKGVESFLQVAESRKTPAFLVNQGSGEDEAIGDPRGKFKHWIGELRPDDEEAGFVLANLLIERAMRLGVTAPDGNVQVIGIEGIHSDFASRERTKGLLRAIQSRSDAVLRQIVPANWDEGHARLSFEILKRRYPNVTVAWAASDLMALGIIAATRTHNLEPGLDIINGGIDWTAEGMYAVKSGEMNVSVGGHFMEGAWVAILLYDYLNGKDFADFQLRWRSRMLPITRQNVEYYQEHLAQERWEKIDFTQFSRVYHPEQPRYNFSLERVMLMLEQR